MSSPSFLRRQAPAPAGPAPVRALTTTCEGVRILQGLCRIETLPSTLWLQPWVSEGGPPTDEVGLATLLKAGALVDESTVHPTISAWLETLASPDITLCVYIRRGTEHMSLVIARRDRRHAAASRCNDDVTLEEVSSVRSMRDLVDRITPLCGPAVEAARFAPATVPTEALLSRLGEVVRGDHTALRALGSLGLTAEQREVVMLAADSPLMEATFAVTVHDRRGEHVSVATASIADTSLGRVVTGPVRGEDGKWWTQIVPGTNDAAARALTSLVATVGGREWQSYSRLK